MRITAGVLLLLLSLTVGESRAQTAVSAVLNAVEEHSVEEDSPRRRACELITAFREDLSSTALEAKLTTVDLWRARDDARELADSLTERCSRDESIPVLSIQTLIAALEDLNIRPDDVPDDEPWELINSRKLEELSALVTAEGNEAIAAGATVLTPGFGVIEPSVGFTAGLGVAYTGGDTPGDDMQSELAVGSNLLGYLVETAARSVFGSEPFFDYLKDNLIIGASLPLNEGGISTQLGLALGGIGGGGMTFWPSLSLVALDTADVRIPGELRDDDVDANTFTSPVLSLSIIPRSEATISRLIQQKKLVYAFTLSVGFPYYHSGGLIDALGALFTNPGGFDRVGDPTISLSVSIPFVRLERRRTQPGTN